MKIYCTISLIISVYIATCQLIQDYSFDGLMKLTDNIFKQNLSTKKQFESRPARQSFQKEFDDFKYRGIEKLSGIDGKFEQNRQMRQNENYVPIYTQNKNADNIKKQNPNINLSFQQQLKMFVDSILNDNTRKNLVNNQAFTNQQKRQNKQVINQLKKQPKQIQSKYTEIIQRTVEGQSKKQMKNVFQYEQKRSQSTFYSSNNQIKQSSSFTTNKVDKEQRKKQIKNRQFSGIGLYTQIPTQFYQKQIFRFAGVLLNKPSLYSNIQDQKYVNIIIKQVNGNHQIRCSQKYSQELQFEISCRFLYPGRFQIAIIQGLNGFFNNKFRNVIQMPTSQFKVDPGVAKPVNPRLQVINNYLYVLWDSEANQTNITVYQNANNQNKTLVYLLTNSHQKYKLPFSDFNSFDYSTTFIEISHIYRNNINLYEKGVIKPTQQNSEIVRLSFLPYDHAFSQFNQLKVQLQTQMPWVIQIGQKYKLSAIFKQDVKNQVFIVEPDLTITKLYFQPSLGKTPQAKIRAGTRVFLQLYFTKQGTNIVQINSVTGLALINRPFYVGKGYPLIPDYKDLEKNSYQIKNITSNITFYQNYYQRTTGKLNIKQPLSYSSLELKRQYLLHLLNGLRKKFKVKAIQLNQQLSNIAQRHSDDMAFNNYLSHTSLNGDSPQQRANKMGFKAVVGENIAWANSLTQAHLGLQRSACHLQTSVQDSWTRVGIGISYSRQNQIYVAFSFSGRDLSKVPLNSSQNKKIDQELQRVLKDKYPQVKKIDRQVEKDVSDWMNGPRTRQILEYVIEGIKKREGQFYRRISYINFSVSYVKNWMQVVTNSRFLDGFEDYTEFSAVVRAKRQQPSTLQSYIIFK